MPSFWMTAGHIVRWTLLAGTAAATVVSLAACGSGTEHGSMPPGMDSSPSPSSTSTTAVFNSADVVFAQMMVPHHRQAVEMAVLAEARAADPEVKALAARIKSAQDPEIRTMTGWLTTWGQPTAMPVMGKDHGTEHGSTHGMMSDGEMAKLAAVSGQEFDRQFCTMMILHHEGAVIMARTELEDGANDAAKALAQQIVTTQQAEIDAMKEILARF